MGRRAGYFDLIIWVYDVLFSSLFHLIYNPHLQLFNGLLQPEADECSQGVVENQQHDGIDKVEPLEIRVHNELPCLGAVALNDGGDAK